MKKFVPLILFAVLSFTILLFLNTKEVEATSSNSQKDVTSVYKETLKFEVDENKNAKLKKVDLGNEKEQIKQADIAASELNHDYLYNYDSSISGDRVDLYSNKETKIKNKTKGKVPGYVEVQVETLLSEKNKSITNVIRITKVIGTKPMYVNASNNLLANKSVNGKYIRVLAHTKKFMLGEIKAGASSSKSFRVGGTSFYKREFSASVVWKDSPPVVDSKTSAPFLANKKAVLYPYAKNNHNKKVMPAPAYANMKVIPVEDREKRDKKIRDKYKSWYIKKYGDPKWNWNDYEIHHIIPLQYGGDNDMNNLFPLKKDFHRKTVTPWWAGY
ncbi:HNH endonuclease signature motif containing protein [Bacillus halotolerans]|uniref:HNH endonuclease signature motif containing protein n=1 Tax=Bacillus halotolerans TaxID=260554 RepID=UPI000D02686C|nr:HNH endonuclease signature motif containing protein [Bacillus halotolerans]PRS05155.1 HNH endonuclease [Bacillus halotolerans]QKS04920.1 HNH endonuclease [Bacillus halotolerans]